MFVNYFLMFIVNYFPLIINPPIAQGSRGSRMQSVFSHDVVFILINAVLGNNAPDAGGRIDMGSAADNGTGI